MHYSPLPHINSFGIVLYVVICIVCLTLSSFVLLAGSVELSTIPRDFRTKIKDDLKTLFDLTKPEKTDLGTFHLFCVTLMIYVYVYTRKSHISNYGISIELWDSLASIIKADTRVQLECWTWNPSGWTTCPYLQNGPMILS